VNLINSNREVKAEMLVDGSVSMVLHSLFLPTALRIGSISAWYFAEYGIT
jgi:hypothetical protein